MDNQTQKRSSFLPLLFIGLITVFFLQYLGNDPSPEKDPSSESKTQTKKEVGKKVDAKKKETRGRVSRNARAQNDFRFPKAPPPTSSQEQSIETEPFFVILSRRGGRIKHFYLKSHSSLEIPKQVIAESKDPIAKKYKALEITRGLGMDFQPHIYYSGEQAKQLSDPILNNASFQFRGEKSAPKIGAQEISYSLGLSFRGQRMELRKLYRFYKEENYFRQITILRNLERREIDLSFNFEGKKYYGSLFYKTLGDLGPDSPSERQNPVALGGSGRFFYYGDSLQKRSNAYQSGGGGCGFPAGCTSLDQDGLYSSYIEKPNSLKFMGSHSRYFLAYTEFLISAQNDLQHPDGFAYKNGLDPPEEAGMTAIFSEFRLGPRQQGELSLGAPNTLLDPQTEAFVKAERGNGNRVRLLQAERKDVLIVDNKVFVGARSSHSHAFKNSALMQAAFGKKEANKEAEESLYYSAYTALFSGISDGIILLMRWLYTFIGNYGWCIVIIALGFKLITFPLNQMQVKGMQKMSELRPELEAINQQYAKNPQEKQKRVMQLFKKHNYNPAKGCFPVLVQMPIFVGLYSAFSASVELWRSPFILWMSDLSRPDTVWLIPYLDMNLNILPLLMVASQILYQRFTSIATDPQQKMLMYLMPFMMLIFFWQIPSGVTLYWTMQNFISIAWHQVPLFIRYMRSSGTENLAKQDTAEKGKRRKR